jgi:PAS domain S-box-containing protein
MKLKEFGDKIDTGDHAMRLNYDLEDVESLLKVLELILDQAYVGIIFVDPKGIIRFMNQQYEDLIGIDRKQIYGKHITEFFPDSKLPFIIKTKKPQMGRKYHYKGKGTLIVNRIPIYKGKQFIGAIAQCIFRDISEIKEMAHKLDLLETKVQKYRRTITDLLVPKYNFDDIKGDGEAITRLKNIAEKYAATENSILIGGETGTGKELFAHSIHHASRRDEGPLVCVNCASIPNDLLEAELFGYASGAFTGAQPKGKIGKIELSNTGTLFLDEIGELPLTAQAKLLRVLEEKRVERVGGVHPVEVDFRLVAATNRKFDFLKDNKSFRQDFFYRLSTMTLEIPALRERSEDIPILINYFIQESSANAMKISDNALHALMNYTWPGNIRELKNLMELSICLIPKDSVLEIDHLPQHIIDTIPKIRQHKEHEDFKLKKRIKNDEVQLIKQALRSCRGNKRQAAKLLGISRSSLYNKINQHSLQQHLSHPK